MENMKRLLNIEVTSYCYADCSMCPHDDIKSFGYIELETIDQIVKVFQNEQFWEVSLSGRGEPSLHNKLAEITKKLKLLYVPISIVSTGANLNKKTLIGVNENIDKIRLSVSSIHEKTFKQIHRGLDFKKTWQNIREVIECANEKIVVHLVGGSVIYNDLEDTTNFLRNMGVKEIYLMPLWNRGGLKEQSTDTKHRNEIINKLNIYASENEYLNENKKIGNQISEYCVIGDSSLSVNYKGDIINCFQDFENLNIVGTVFSNHIYQILKERRYNLGKMNICKVCNSARDAIWK